jgi:hypothetical protein
MLLFSAKLMALTHLGLSNGCCLNKSLPYSTDEGLTSSFTDEISSANLIILTPVRYSNGCCINKPV